ncbi:testis-specific serine/threonine-protein kinase 2-like [Oppia nitens]|uniref:testis-specific serine/threonine-protein kinase 2-like n=1 Tax=Oppia nitens TaxID=1686743 RepID=UPI0023D9DCE4|nr:testis-specific serine/threonine-protein kinase 2-like [Oppia nitens]
MTEDTIDLDPKTAAVMKKKGYEFQKKLSQGAFGQVYKGTNSKTGIETVAIKVMDLKAVGEKFKDKFLPREIDALIGVKHDNTVFIYDIIRCNHKMYIFMEFCTDSDVANYLQKNNAIPEEKSCIWFTQVSQAVCWMHTNLHMAHRDIKLDNILLTSKSGELIAKLTDFGFSKKCWNEDQEKVELSKTFCGTEPYYSPQIVSKKEYNAFAADVWALGVVLFCMLNNKFPFHFNDSKRQIKEQTDRSFIDSRFIKDFGKDLKDLHYKCWTENEKNRITIQDLLKHPWIVRKGK